MTAATAITSVSPERPGGQGLDHNQEESGNLAIHKLLTTEDGQAWTDFVATARQAKDGTWRYEAWSLRGMVAWVRTYAADGGYDYTVVETLGQNPLMAQDHRALSTFREELAAGSGDPETNFVEPAALTYPYAYERLSQLFDSPNAPDLAVNPKAYCYGRQPGQHGALDVIQSRSPLVFSGPGVKRGAVSDAASRQIDIAPTIARLMGLPLIDGKDVTRTADGGLPAVLDTADIRTTVRGDTLVIRPGHETKFVVDIERRNGFAGRVPLEVRGLPHGVRVLNIGLNGILVTERDTSREVTLYCEPWVRAMEHPVVVLAKREGKNTDHAARSVLLRVQP